MNRVLAFVGAVLSTYLLAAVIYSQLNLANLTEMGVEVSGAMRAQTAWHDLLGMATLYLPIIGVAFLIAFAFTRLVLKWLPQPRTLGYILAGFVAIFTVNEALVAFGSGVHPLAVTRTFTGLMSQCVAGAIGGWVFASLRKPADTA